MGEFKGDLMGDLMEGFNLGLMGGFNKDLLEEFDII